MTDDDKTAPLAPVAVTVIDTGGHGVAALKDGTIAETPSKATPNLAVTVIGPVMAIFIRFLNAYLLTLVGLVGAGLTSDAIPATDFVQLVVKCAALSLAGPGFGVLKDLLTIFGRLESKYPLLTGSV